MRCDIILYHVVFCYMFKLDIDALGKPGAGITYGNIKWFGAYDQCRGIKKSYFSDYSGNTSEINIDGKYCMTQISTGEPVIFAGYIDLHVLWIQTNSKLHATKQ